MHELAQLAVVNHALKKILILAPVSWLVLEEEIMKANRGAAEGIGFDDVGTGFEIAAVNLIDDLGFCEQQNFQGALEILSLPILKARAPVIRFRQLVLLNHCAHSAVEDDDAFAH